MRRIFTPILITLCVLSLSGCFDRQTASLDSGEVQLGGPGFVTLSWSATPGEQDGFYIEASTNNQNFNQVASVADGTTTATVKGLGKGTTYYFRIRGYNSSGISPPSTAVTASVP
jgi:hypothetical protein